MTDQFDHPGVEPAPEPAPTLPGVGVPPTGAPPPAAPSEGSHPAPPGGPIPGQVTPWGDAPTEPVPPAGPDPTGEYPTPALPFGQFGGPPPAPTSDPVPGRVGSDGLRGRGWIAVAAVAALIGGGAGAGISALTDDSGNSGSTVNITENNARPGAAVLSGNVSIPKLVDKVLPAVVSIDVKSAGQEDQGTGMIISSNGMVITNNHVIANGGTITVTESGTTKAQPATLVGADPANDVALLKIDNASGLPAVTFGDSNKVVVGDAVVAIGNALGLQAGTPTVTQGIVSALGRTVTASSSLAGSETLTNLIQTDAAINPGNSGGPLIDSTGSVIGMNTAVAGSTSDGSNAQNIGFAIPSKKIESLLGELEKGGTAPAGGAVLGISITTETAQLRQQYGFTPSQGAVIMSVVTGSPADKAGLQQGDVIVGIDSATITSADEVSAAFGKHKAGDTVSVTYYRGNLKHTVSATLESRAAERQQAQNGQTVVPGLGGGVTP
jgi:S1-C subfamily serine protease